MKPRILHTITGLLKVASIITTLTPMLGANENNAIYGALAFMASSVLKDFLIALGDYLDDGKMNKSFRGLPLNALALCGLLTLSGCAGLPKRADMTPEERAAYANALNTGVTIAGQLAIRALAQK